MQDQPRPEETVRRISKRFLVFLVIGAVVVAGGIHSIYLVQRERNTQALLVRANAAEEAGDDQETIRLLTQYGQLNPDNIDVLVRLIALIDKTSNSARDWQRMYVTCEEILRRDPERADAGEIRYRIVQTAMRLGRFQDALIQLQLLRLTGGITTRTEGGSTFGPTAGDEADLCFLQGRCHDALGDAHKAISYYLASIQMAADRVEPYQDSITFLQTHADEIPTFEALRDVSQLESMEGFTFEEDLLAIFAEPEEEDQATVPDENVTAIQRRPQETEAQRARRISDFLVDRMVKNAMPREQAYLTAAKYHLQFADADETNETLDTAGKELQLALEHAPDDGNIRLAAAQFEVAQGDKAFGEGKRQEASKRYAKALEHVNHQVELGVAGLRLSMFEVQVIAQQMQLKPANEHAAGMKAITEVLERSIEELPAVRERVTANPETSSRYQDQGAIYNIDIELRWRLADALISLLEIRNTELRDASTPPRMSPVEVSTLYKRVDELIQELGNAGARQSLRDYVECRALTSKLVTNNAPKGQNWSTAAEKLESTRPLLDSDSVLRRRLDLMLSSCYDRLNNYDAQLIALRRAVSEDPRWIQGRLELASRLTQLNRNEEALDEYGRIGFEFNIGAAQIASLAIQLKMIRSSPNNKYNLEKLENALNAVLKSAPDSYQVQLLFAEFLLIQKQFDTAKQHLEKALELADGSPQEAEIWASLAKLELETPGEEMPRRIQKAEDVIRLAVSDVGQRIELKLLEIALAEQKPEEELLADLERIEAESQEIDPQVRVEIWQSLARAYFRLAENEQHRSHAAEKINALTEWAISVQPYNLNSYLLRGDYALSYDRSAVEAQLKEIRRVEGNNGANGNYIEASWKLGQLAREKLRLSKEAEHTRETASAKVTHAYQQQLSTTADDDERRKLAEAHRAKVIAIQQEYKTTLAEIKKRVDSSGAQIRTLLNEAGVQRPLWPPIEEKLGDLERLAQNEPQAIEHYKRALSQGSRSQRVLLATLSFLSRTGRDDEALGIVQRYKENSPSLLTGDVAVLASKISFRKRQPELGLELATGGAANLPKYRQKTFEGVMKFLEYQTMTPNEQKSAAGRKKLAEAKALYQVPLAADVAGSELDGRHDPKSWMDFFTFLARTNDVKGAREAIEQAGQGLPETPPHLRPLTQAIGYNYISDFDMAEAKFEEAIAAAPTEKPLRATVIDFYLRIGKPEAAKPHLKYLKANADGDASLIPWVNMRLSLIQASAGSYDEGTAALKNLNRESVASNSDLILNLRAQAIVLSRRSTRQDRMRLIEVFEKLDDLQSLTDADLLKLARLYRSVGRWNSASPNAKETYERIISASTWNPVAVSEMAFAYMAQNNLSEEEIAEIDELVKRLEDFSTNAFQTLVARGTLMNVQNRSADGVARIQEYTDRMEHMSLDRLFMDFIALNDGQRATNLLSQHLSSQDERIRQRIITRVSKNIQDGNFKAALDEYLQHISPTELTAILQSEFTHIAAGIFEGFGEFEAAEKTFRRFANSKQDKPEAQLVVASYLGRRQQAEAALEICRQVWASAPLASATVSVGILRATGSSAEQIEEVEKMIAKEIGDTTGDKQTGLSLVLADLCDLQQRYDKSEAIYRSILEKDPKNVVALNNLAWLLSFQPGKAEEGRSLISKAIQLAGPVGTLLDTEGLILVQLQESNKAIENFERAVSENPTGLMYFHLALGHLHSNNPDSARSAWEDAQNDGFSSEKVHHLEYPQYEKLRDALKLETASNSDR